ncbi:hypothetical protein GCM10009125_09640 [Castellaniella daejeonensis]|uniref:Uncharacterized protein n=1 Tax=Castellaniella daejeonensis TaxID=659013 RepID=A0ABP3D5U2_9BURK
MDLLDPLSSALPSVAPLTPMGAKAMAGGALANPPSSAQPAISSLGRALFEAASGTQSSATGRYQDIEDSDLPEAVKNLLRMIRDLRAKLAQLMRELRAVQADDSMNPEARRIRLQQIQAQMSALNGALIAATQKLAALMRDIRLGKGQQMAAAQLALR